jgi:hypothetical protein
VMQVRAALDQQTFLRGSDARFQRLIPDFHH